jgi:hypothetical protein
MTRLQPTSYFLMGKTEIFSSKVRNETGCLLSPLLFNGLGILARAIRQEEEIKEI